MARVKLNQYGKNLYPWLIDTWLTIYGFNSDKSSFLIWDNIEQKWKYISYDFCEGE